MDTATGSKGATEGELVTARAELAEGPARPPVHPRHGPDRGAGSRAEIRAGNLVVVASRSRTFLTTIVSSNQVWVYFDIDQPCAAPARCGASPHRSPPHAGDHRELQVPVQLGLANESGFPHTGGSTSSTTGSIRRQGRCGCTPPIGEPGGPLRTSFFVRVKLATGEPKPTALVTERAIGTDQGRKYVLVVNDKNVVEYREVQLGPLADGLRAISSGLAPGEWVIVNGIQRARPGITVAPQRVAMEPKAPMPPPASPQVQGGSGSPANS